jgi:hypothetical protein
MRRRWQWLGGSLGLLAIGSVAHATVDSWKGRIGHVVPKTGDYTCDAVGCPTPNACTCHNLCGDVPADCATPSPTPTSTP